jgi:hypothetical protein
MTFSTYRYLFAVDGGHVECKPLELLSSFANVANVMHFYLCPATANGTIVQEFRLGSSRIPGRLEVEIG